MKRLWFLATLLLCGMMTARAQSSDDLELQARNGVPEAQFALGEKYRNGSKGIPKDHAKAFYWIRKAADQGYALAQATLGYLYQNGYGTDKDPEKAFYLYQLSAEKGVTWAQNALGDCYYFGEGVTQDFKTAVEWYRKAAERNLPDAYYNLGWCYEKGKGLEPDQKLALLYYRKAASLKQMQATTRLSELGFDTTQIKEQAREPEMTPDMVAPVDIYSVPEAHVNESTLANAEAGNMISQYVVGEQYFQQGHEPEAFHWWRESSEQGYGKASLKIGMCFYQGGVIPHDYPAAVFWFTKAAEQGEKEGYFMLGQCHERGNGVPQEFRKAAECYDKGGYSNDAARCTRKWLQQTHADRDDYLAMSVGQLERLAGEEDPLAQCHLGLVNFTENNRDEAMKWLKACLNNSKADAGTKDAARKFADLIDAINEDEMLLYQIWGLF